MTNIPSNDEEELMTLAAVARKLKVPRAVVDALLIESQVPVLQVTDHKHVRVSELPKLRRTMKRMFAPEPAPAAVEAEWVTLTDAARHVGLSSKSLKRLLDKSGVEVLHLTSNYKVRLSDVEEVYKSRLRPMGTR